MWLATGFLPPHLIDRCDRQGNPRDSAPIVVAGILVSDTQILHRVPEHADPSTPLQLRQLRVTVENVLKGDLSRGDILVYYFAFAGGFDGPRPLGMWRTGDRRVLWLRRDNGVLRTACDGWDDCSEGVYSGAHPHLVVDSRKPVAYAVADILLTRGEGKIADGTFAAAVLRGAPVADDYLIGKYRQLALTGRPPVQTAACMGLWAFAHESKLADEAMQGAGCRCTAESDRNPACAARPRARRAYRQ